MRKIGFIIIVALLVVVMAVPALAGRVKVGDVLPDFEMKDLNGKPVKVSDFRGQYVIYDVWATWCKYCIPVLDDYQRNLKTIEAAGVKVVAVSVDTKVETITDYLKKEKKDWTFTITHDKTNNSSRIWGVTGIPQVYVVDPNGRVIFMHTGLNEFGSFWANVTKAMELSKNPPVQANKLSTGSYTGKIADISELYMLDLELPIAAKPWKLAPETKLKKEPKYESTPKFATFNAGDKVFTVVAVKKDAKVENYLYVDFNGNGDLTEEGERIQMEGVSDPNTGEMVYHWAGPVQVTVEKGVTMNYRLIAVFFDAQYSELYLIPAEGYEVELKADKGVVKTWVIDLNGNGKFGEDADMVLMDLNQNGEFDDLSGSEIIALKENLVLKGGKYQLKISGNGKEFSVSAVK